jgi:hypothetical protein
MLASFRSLRVVGFLALFASAACEDTAAQPKLAETCASSGDCAAAQACANGTCHIGCKTSAECANQGGGICVRADNGVYVCQLESERSCVRNSDCSGTQVCGVDQNCRDSCTTPADCRSEQVCTSGVCVEADDTLSPAKTPCLTPSDCPPDLTCINKFCGAP